MRRISRRPLTKLTCAVVTDDEDGPLADPIYCAEMIPVDFPRQTWTMPKQAGDAKTSLTLMIHAGRSLASACR